MLSGTSVLSNDWLSECCYASKILSALWCSGVIPYWLNNARLYDLCYVIILAAQCSRK